MHRVLVGLLVVLGRPRAALEENWHAVLPNLHLALLGEMSSIDPAEPTTVADLSVGSVWAESAAATEGLRSEEVLAKGSLAVQVMLEWLAAARLTRHVLPPAQSPCKGSSAGSPSAAQSGEPRARSDRERRQR